MVRKYVHKIITFDDKEYNQLNLRYAVMTAESRIRPRRLRLLQTTLGLSTTNNKTYYRCMDLVDAEKRKQAHKYCKIERDKILKYKGKTKYQKKSVSD